MPDDTVERATRIIKESQDMIAAVGDCSLDHLFAKHGLDYTQIKSQVEKIDQKLTTAQRDELQQHISEMIAEQKRSVENAVAAARREILIRKRGGLRRYA